MPRWRACSLPRAALRVSSLKTERIRGRFYRTRNDARADVFDYIESFYNAVRRHSTIGYINPVEFEKKVGLAYPTVHRTGSRPVCYLKLLSI